MRTIIIANGPEYPGTEARSSRGDRYLYMDLYTVDQAQQARGMTVDDIVWMTPPRDDVLAAVLPRLSAAPGVYHEPRVTRRARG